MLQNGVTLMSYLNKQKEFKMSEDKQVLRVYKEDHALFKELAKKNGMTIQGYFSQVAKRLQKEELIKEL